MTTKSKKTPIDATIARSWLLVNGARPELFDQASASKADQIVLDIEDAVDPSHKLRALDDVANWLDAGGEAWVRVNDRNTDFWQADMDRLRNCTNLRGVMLAKVESASHVEDTFAALGGRFPVLALVETALGIEEVTNIARARGAFRLAFGSGDYRRDTGTAMNDLAMAYPRSRLVVASRVGNLPGPIDGPTVGTSHAILREQSELSVALGMTGKLCLALDQLPVVNETICPTRSDVAWAVNFLNDFEAAGRVIRDGSDLPRLGRAEKIKRLADAFGIEPE
ncbi:MAG: CoA ester lyase [Actinomycetales bacterium]|nr:CoA ester lyase [Actinomycetales bacterium]